MGGWHWTSRLYVWLPRTDESAAPRLFTYPFLHVRTYATRDEACGIRDFRVRKLLLKIPRWTEVIIFLLIIVNALVLTIQSAPSLTLPDAAGGAQNPMPTPVRGYFHTWEDYALFVVFVVYT